MTIDRCEACGFIWLDPGELRPTLVYVRELAGGRQLPGDVEELLANPEELKRRIQMQPRGITTNEIVREIIAAILIGLFGS